MSNYSKSAEIAGKVLIHMKEATCKAPSVTLFPDGSGQFTVYDEDAKVACDILNRCFTAVWYSGRPTNEEGETAFDFSFVDLEGYTSVCHTCKRPLEEETEDAN